MEFGATNCADNAVPMVKGKNTVVRVYPAVSVLGPTGLPNVQHNAELHIEAPIRASIPSLNGPILLGPVAYRYMADNTLNFLLPLAWTEFDEIELRVELNADRALPETNFNNNQRVFRVTFHERRPMRIRYVPVRLPGTPSMPDEQAMRRGETLARTIFPLRQGDLHYVRGATLAYDDGISNNNDLIYFVGLWLEAMDSLASLLSPGEPAYDQMVAWYPQQGIAGLWSGLSDPQWADPPGLGRVAAAMNIRDTYNNRYHDPYTLAHEVAHNLGLRHSSKASGPPTAAAACRAKSDVNHWPYETIDIQEVGYEPLVRGQKALKEPWKHSDLMSYCNYYDVGLMKLDADWSKESTAFWISPFSYHQLFQADGRPSFGLPVAAQASAIGLESEWAVVRGVVSQSGASAIHSVQHVSSGVGADSLPTGTDYSIEWQDASGIELGSFFFDVDFLNQEMEPVDEEPFLFVLPFPADAEQVVLKRDATVLASRERSAHAPTLAITAPIEGASWSDIETIAWEADDADGDPVTVSLLYRGDDSSAWLPIDADVAGSAITVDSGEYPGGTDARVLLVATDGFNTTIATSEPFSVPRKAPQPVILEPADGAELPLGSPVVLVGSGHDPEDGALDAATFEWSSDRVGLFATGAEVVLDELAQGDHRLTLTARDSDGATGSDTITVHVRGNCAGDCDGGATVTVDELIKGVNIALGAAEIELCPSFDTNGSNTVTVEELIKGVNNALSGCEVPGMTPTPTSSQNPSPTQTSSQASRTATPSATSTMRPTQTRSGTATRTMTPRPPVLHVSTVSGHPGDDVEFIVTLESNGFQVSGVQNEITFDPPDIRVASGLEGAPDCTVNPALGLGSSCPGFVWRPAGCSGASCHGIFALVCTYDFVAVLPDAEMYRCRVRIASDAAVGTHPLTVSGLSMADADGFSIPGAVGTNGAAVVGPLSNGTPGPTPPF